MILLYSQFKGQKTIWVHNDMLAEIKTEATREKKTFLNMLTTLMTTLLR
ncbi:MAG: hypothetical protein ACLTZI_02725 [[Eubacterium] siraeum]